MLYRLRITFTFTRHLDTSGADKGLFLSCAGAVNSTDKLQHANRSVKKRKGNRALR
mgnify:CR=1 FL=1